ncbi:hypothetical protein [Nonomuraea dietziae]|uniref:hypothetical protein n=1 Tax=Nonomuraea dietziae TaxID=65515 RepID=UPI0031D43F41
MSLSLDPAAGVVYLGGDVLGGRRHPAGQDLRLGGRLRPQDAHRALAGGPGAGQPHLPGHQGPRRPALRVYKRNSGAWIALDLATRTVRHQGALSGYGELTVHRGRVFASVFFGGRQRLRAGHRGQAAGHGAGRRVVHQPPAALRAGLMEGLGAVGQELARIGLDPRCPQS